MTQVFLLEYGRVPCSYMNLVDGINIQYLSFQNPNIDVVTSGVNTAHNKIPVRKKINPVFPTMSQFKREQVQQPESCSDITSTLAQTLKAEPNTRGLFPQLEQLNKLLLTHLTEGHC